VGVFRTEGAVTLRNLDKQGDPLERRKMAVSTLSSLEENDIKTGECGGIRDLPRARANAKSATLCRRIKNVDVRGKRRLSK